MQTLQRGQRLPLANIGLADSVQIGLNIHGLPVDFACFGLTQEGKMVSDDYMTFFNQTKTPCGGVTMAQQPGYQASFKAILNLLPPQVDRLILTATVDGQGVMNQMTNGHVHLSSGSGATVASFDMTGREFAQEKAIMLIDIYCKNGEWRIATNGQGFNGGLDALVKHFGGVVAEQAAPASSPVPSPTPTSPQSPARISLEKRIAKEAPQLINLAKKATISLEKKGLQNTVARVGIVLDASGSMHWQYKDGKVQELLNRILPLAIHFDDDGELDVWAFGGRSTHLTAANTGNIQSYTLNVDGGWKQWLKKTSPHTNNEPEALKQVIEHYRANPTAPPAYVIFVSDGGVGSNKEISEIIRASSQYPIFWQFVGIGGRNYGILERLDTMTGRRVDNAGFFAIDDLDSISEGDLYDRLLSEFPLWLMAAKNQGVIR